MYILVKEEKESYIHFSVYLILHIKYDFLLKIELVTLLLGTYFLNAEQGQDKTHWKKIRIFYGELYFRCP